MEGNEDTIRPLYVTFFIIDKECALFPTFSINVPLLKNDDYVLRIAAVGSNDLLLPIAILTLRCDK